MPKIDNTDREEKGPGKDRQMAATKMRAKGQVTIPKDIVERARLDEGDPIEVEMTESGILLKPQKVISAAQAWFWTSEWQEGEREASRDIAEGRVEVFKTDEDFLASLDD